MGPEKLIDFKDIVRRRSERFEDSLTPEELLPVIFYDEDLVVINKPAGIPMNRNHENPRGITELLKHYGRGDAAPAHRLDIDTSGVLISGRTLRARRSLNRQFQGREIRKSYTALVDGEWDTDIAAMIAPIKPGNFNIVEVGVQEGAKNAVTSFRHLETFYSEGETHSLLKIRIFTGRQHQIRAHLAELGFPITGDPKYNPEGYANAPRMFLHCSEIVITHPKSHKKMTFTAPLPSQFPQ